MSGKKKNPRSIPRTQQDVDRAYDKGLIDGTKSALTILLYVLKDNFGADDNQIQEFSDAFNYTIDSIDKGYVTETDLAALVKEEYGTVIRMT